MPRAAASAATDAKDDPDPLGVNAVALPEAGVADAEPACAEAEEPGGTADELGSVAWLSSCRDVAPTPPAAAPVVPAAAAA